MEVGVVLEGSSEEVVAVSAAVLAAGASTTLVVARGYPSVLEVASELLLGVELVAALAWEVEVVVVVDLVVVELVAVSDLVSVVEVVGTALVEVLVGLALVADREAAGGLALGE